MSFMSARSSNLKLIVKVKNNFRTKQIWRLKFNGGSMYTGVSYTINDHVKSGLRPMQIASNLYHSFASEM
jgi:hypothetical protein